MSDEPKTPLNVDEYIARFPPEVQEKLVQVRRVIRQVAPDAQETIKYRMPAYTLDGNLVYFAAYKKFISVYPLPEGDARFQEEISVHRAQKSTARFPLNGPIPEALIGKLVELRLDENRQRAATKRKR